MRRSNHYDEAFAAFLRHSRIPYVSVDESRRALLQQASLKSFDFIVYSAGDCNLLVDVKGRRWPAGGTGHRWENWATSDDIHSLQQWEQIFGDGYRAVLVFAYLVESATDWPTTDPLFEFRQRLYGFYAVSASDYRDQMKTRSTSWDTVSVPSAPFRELRTPIAALL